MFPFIFVYDRDWKRRIAVKDRISSIAIPTDASTWSAFDVDDHQYLKQQRPCWHTCIFTYISNPYVMHIYVYLKVFEHLRYRRRFIYRRFFPCNPSFARMSRMSARIRESLRIFNSHRSCLIQTFSLRCQSRVCLWKF